MTRYACMLRGINVAGQRKVAMKELIDLCLSLGYTGVESYLQSGNIVLNTEQDANALESALQQAICREFDYADVDVLARSAADLQTVLKALPENWKSCDKAALHFTFTRTAAAISLTDDAGLLPDEFCIGDRVVYIHCPNGYGKTKLNNSFFERKLKLRATTRNWNTTNKLYELTRG